MHIHSLKAINERTTHYADLALLKNHFYRLNSLAEAFYYVKLWGGMAKSMLTPIKMSCPSKRLRNSTCTEN
eukprot:COSAG05_NODE_2818_length_2608_cov_2116.518932_2_plen_71_part_00